MGAGKGDIDAILARVRTWPPSRRDDAVRVLLAMEAADTAAYLLSDDERSDLEAALDEVARGEVASETETAAVLDRLLR